MFLDSVRDLSRRLGLLSPDKNDDYDCSEPEMFESPESVNHEKMDTNDDDHILKIATIETVDKKESILPLTNYGPNVMEDNYTHFEFKHSEIHENVDKKKEVTMSQKKSKYTHVVSNDFF